MRHLKQLRRPCRSDFQNGSHVTKTMIFKRAALALLLSVTLMAGPQVVEKNQMLQSASAAGPAQATPAWAGPATIYEVNVRQFSSTHNFNGVTAQLGRLKTLGVDILWLMPIYPIGVPERKGTLGSPYSVVDYLGVNPEFGTAEDLHRLINGLEIPIGFIFPGTFDAGTGTGGNRNYKRGG